MVQGSGFRVHGSWFMIHGSWFMCHGSWFIVWVLVLRLSFRPRVQSPKSEA